MEIEGYSLTSNFEITPNGPLSELGIIEYQRVSCKTINSASFCNDSFKVYHALWINGSAGCRSIAGNHAKLSSILVRLNQTCLLIKLIQIHMNWDMSSLHAIHRRTLLTSPLRIKVTIALAYTKKGRTPQDTQCVHQRSLVYALSSTALNAYITEQ